MSSCSQCNGTGEETLLGGTCRFCYPHRRREDRDAERFSNEWRVPRQISFVLAVVLVVASVVAVLP